MSLSFVLLPLFVQVILTLALGGWLASLRAPAVRRGEVRAGDVALREPNWPKRTLQINNSYLNQFELPVLFYVLTILAIFTKHADVLFVTMSWLFVLSRLAHAYIHTTSNRLAARGGFFGIGALILALMWLIFIVRIMLGLP